MFNKYITRMLQRRHYWRSMSFDELSEIYASQFIRTLAISIVGVFVPLYLYRLGYSINSVLGYYVLWFLPRPLFDVVSAHIVGWFGPKLSLLGAALFHCFYLVLLLGIDTFHLPLFVVAFTGTATYSLHQLAVQVDFSRMKHKDHGGTELSYTMLFEKIGAILGPLAGGLIAGFFGPRYMVVLSLFLLIMSTVPLFLTLETMQTRQRIRYRGLPMKDHVFDVISVIPTTMENMISILIWPMLAGIYLLGSQAFLKLGIIISLSTMSAVLTSLFIGRLIDKSKGRLLLRTGAVLNAVLHLFRPFVFGVPAVAAVSVINEPVTTMYRMPYLKGFYDAADDFPGQRIAYISLVSAIDSFSRFVLLGAIYILALYIEPKSILQYSFFFAALCSLGVMTERFRALDRKVV